MQKNAETKTIYIAYISQQITQQLNSYSNGDHLKKGRNMQEQAEVPKSMREKHEKSS